MDNKEYFKKYQNLPQETVDTMEDFLFFAENNTNKTTKEDIKFIKSLVAEFLGNAPEKLGQAELELLDKWTKRESK